MTKRERIRMKYNGLCAYSGQPLGDDWQIDHVTSKFLSSCPFFETDVNDFSNLLPTLKILNHYKRAKDLKQWRDYLLTLHERLRKLPHNPKAKKSIRRKEYLLTVAAAFGITVDNPFSGIFHFEKINNQP